MKKFGFFKYKLYEDFIVYFLLKMYGLICDGMLFFFKVVYIGCFFLLFFVCIGLKL